MSPKTDGFTLTTAEPKAAEVAKAYLISKYAHESASSLAQAFEQVRARRIKSKKLTVKGGATTDEEQDLLRAILVFAGSGLDSMLKQLIRDCLPSLAACDAAVQKKLEEFALRRLKAATSEAPDLAGTKLLAAVLAAESPRSKLIEAYVQELTGGSLQSMESLSRSLDALGLGEKELKIDRKALDEIFKARNKIVHEFDLNFDHPKRNRQTRKRESMVKDARAILRLTGELLAVIDRRLSARPQESSGE